MPSETRDTTEWRSPDEYRVPVDSWADVPLTSEHAKAIEYVVEALERLKPLPPDTFNVRPIAREAIQIIRARLAPPAAPSPEPDAGEDDTLSIRVAAGRLLSVFDCGPSDPRRHRAANELLRALAASPAPAETPETDARDAERWRFVRSLAYIDGHGDLCVPTIAASHGSRTIDEVIDAARAKGRA